MKRTRLLRRTPLKRGPAPMRRTRLRPRSAKRDALMVERRALVERVLRERPRCEFPTAAKCALEGSACNGYTCPNRSQHLHEKLTRARGGSILDESNILALCAPHHSWLHDHSDDATALGLLVPSWSKR